MKYVPINETEIKQAIDRVVNRTFKMDMTWDWPAGVAFYGVGQAYLATGETSYLEQLQAWIDEQLEEGIPPLTVNAVSIGHTLLTLYEQTKSESYLDVAVQMAQFLSTDAVRFADGVFQHTVSQNYDFPQQAWVDTMFMAGYFLIRIGSLLRNDAWLEDGLLQYHAHELFLQDRETNLYYHGWDHLAQNNMSAVYWARGNSWAAYTMSEALHIVEVTHPSYMRVYDSLRDQLSSIVRLQSDNGLWHTVLNDPTAYEETSGSAGLTAALLRYNEAIGAPMYNKFIQKAIPSLLSKIPNNGTVLEVSAGTAVMKDASGYKGVAHERIQGWGQGLTLVFLSSLLGYKWVKNSSQTE
ncbi:glycoside hydrolase family 88 protein [Paenibacillus alginolyticus]|uniref:Glycoside hydrolase family 88 protein n=1 Tax=Paenibacillus alginolyticus TaxID=59839 RepID=A0ABT4GN24_9BACL|nr:glycoside hydrolase family 88 protein [Paenibacillus alginolyticus]MCY9668118.1 glycoside hydrolase family 88 protein [Paenibacillus alginolyticus]MCY9697476.1 glycoside hydrolase family 88 protein [Paenibacillus alginolyticus]MEC0148289.1 glycoside hydrolase family 88 protein [Paenibacillus alginolyticus]